MLNLNDLPLLVGSGALRAHGIEKMPRDIDLIAKPEAIGDIRKDFNCKGEKYTSIPTSGGKKWLIKTKDIIYDIEVAWPESLADDLLHLVLVYDKFVDLEKYIVPSIDVLYTLKMSHRYLRNSRHFLKTMEDIHYLRTRYDAKIPEWLERWYRLRQKETYNYEHPVLNTNTATFFDTPNITYTYNHDDIHQAMKLYAMPAYHYYMKDGEEVLCDKDKFFKLSNTMRLTGVYEEAIVLALERSQIPF